MSLQIGQQLGSYEITSLIGKGGMGEVYRARDTRLNRVVAIKILPEHVSNNLEMKQRFEREAQTIAGFNHPHICSLYDVGPDYLVMEFIEGKPLSGPLPVEQALAFGRQILDALDAAHRKGIVHRDLKPANILVTKPGVKLLDFGLAKTVGTANPDAVTITHSLTEEGTILGTLQYMSPEQVEGKEADVRSDIFAFGLVLYEMITGKPVFEGVTRASLIASILKDQPKPISELQPLAPKALDRVLETCLQKDPEQRWQSARDVKNALNLISTEAPRVAKSKGAWLWKGAAAVLTAMLAVTLWVPRRVTPPEAVPIRFQFRLPQGEPFSGRMAVSPDGRKLVFGTSGPDAGLWIRDLDSSEPRRLLGTQNDGGNMFWSPDSRFVAFAAGNELKKIDVSGGVPVTLVKMPSAVGVGAWNEDDVIIFARVGIGPLYRVSAAGGAPVPITRLESLIGDEFHAIPSFLSDNRHFVYLRTSGIQGKGGVYVGSLDAGLEEQLNKQLIVGPRPLRGPLYVDGRLFFLVGTTLMYQHLDEDRFELVGEPVPIAEDVGNSGAGGWFSVSKSGVLAYRTGPLGLYQLTWFDRQGKVLGTAGEPSPNLGVALSPDSTRAAILNGRDLWVADFVRGVNSRFTFDQSVPVGNNNGSRGITRYMAGVWFPDSSQIGFTSDRTAAPGIYEKDSSGAGDERLLVESARPSDWSRDGRFLMYQAVGEKTLTDLWVLPRDGDRKPIPWLRTEFNEAQGTFSPDGRWVAYASNESGRSEIYVRPFAASGAVSSPASGKWQVSRDSGQLPKWRADGKELIFRSLDGTPMAVQINTNPTFQAGIPERVFSMPFFAGGVGSWDVTSDGQRFLVAVPVQGHESDSFINVVVNWQAELKR